ncbi:ankyrin repeat-containing domain protein [Aspergillus germanicus]
MSLVTLPQEVLLAIAQQLSDRDLSHLAATSRYALNILEPELYQRGLDYVGASRPALVWTSDLECTRTIEKKVGVANLLLQHGSPTDLDQNERGEFMRRRGLWASAIVVTQPHLSVWASVRNIEASPLGVAAYWEHTDLVSALLKHGARVDVRNEDGHTALWFASIRPLRTSIRLLINAGADIHAPDSHGLTPFDNFNLGADLSGRFSPALDIITYGDIACKHLLVEYGLRRIPDLSPSVLLLAAAALGYRGTTCALLLGYDIDVDATVDLNGRNAPILAASCGHDTTFSIIMRRMTRPIETFRTTNGRNILHLAVQSQDLNTVQLVAAMSDTLITTRDESGDTPLSLVASHGKHCDDIIEFLTSRTVALSRDIDEHFQSRNAITREHVKALKVFIPIARTELDRLEEFDDLLGYASAVTFLTILLFLFMFFLMLLRLGLDATHVPEKEKPIFEDLLRMMLRWKPEDRPSAEDVLKHPWFALDDEEGEVFQETNLRRYQSEDEETEDEESGDDSEDDEIEDEAECGGGEDEEMLDGEMEGADAKNSQSNSHQQESSKDQKNAENRDPKDSQNHDQKDGQKDDQKDGQKDVDEQVSYQRVEHMEYQKDDEKESPKVGSQVEKVKENLFVLEKAELLKVAVDTRFRGVAAWVEKALKWSRK